jgi:siroheme decarboxylase
MNEPAALDTADRRLLEAIQESVPLTPRPYRDLAMELHLDEGEVLERLREIRRKNMISRMSAVFDTRSLGYESVLVAAKVPDGYVEAAGAIINEHPGVSHNYLRTAAYNLWFTLAVPPDSRLGLEKTAALLAHRGGATTYRLLPATRVFKIGMKLALTDSDDSLLPDTPPAAVAQTQKPSRRQCLKQADLTPAVKAAILALQEDLPAEPRPFDTLAHRHALEVEQLLSTGQNLLAAGIMRRYAAVLRHRQVGFAVNCMTVWNVPDSRSEQAGQALSAFREVTHCYLRPAYSDWPYSLYAMIHCRDQQQCRELLDRMKAAVTEAEVLEVYSTKEFKKVRLQYFSPAFEAWEKATM